MRPLYILGLLVAILLLAGVFYYAHSHPPTAASSRQNSPASTSPTSASTTEVARTPPPGYLEYQSTLYHFSLFYPDSLSVKEYKETGTSMTVTFTANDGTNDGFQIFIVPYGESQITPQRLQQDIPSGVIDQQTNIVIDGKPATMFYSTNAVMGDTREVWFINHGFLYEVTTYKQLDTWLAGIMQTWQFI